MVAERKPVPQDWRKCVRLRAKRGHDEGHLDCTGELGNVFRIILRQNNVNSLDFSAILAVHIPKSSRIFRLRRYNGKSHEHTNSIEGDTFYDYHVHLATERYQELGAREDAFAKVTERYNDLHGALNCLLEDSGFIIPPDDQLKLF